MKIRNILLMLGIVFTVFSCPTTTTEDPTNPDGDGDPGSSNKTVLFKSDGDGYLQFYTNDPTKLNKTFWFAGTVSQPTDTYNIEIETKKVTGDQNTGFGIIFCVDPTDINDYLMVQIALSGHYMIGKVTDHVTQTPLIQDWAICSQINKNLNSINKINVRYNNDVSSKKFELYIKDELVCSFIDNTPPAYLSGRWGFIAEVSGMDDVANVPVDIRYKDLTP